MAENKIRKIQLYRTYQLGAVTTNIDLGELALNYNPQSPFIMFKDNNGDIQKLGSLVGVSGNSEYFTMTQKAITDIDTAEKESRIAQDDKIEESIGLAEDGSYIQRTDSNYINDATTVVEAIDKLDEKAKEHTDAIDAIEEYIGLSEGGKPVAEQIEDAINSLDVAEISSEGSYLYSISETDGKISASYKTLVEENDKVLTYTNSGITSTISLEKLTTKEVTELGETNVLEAYKLIGKDSTQLGSTIKIYKDQTLQDVELVNKNDKNQEGQFLKYTYVLADGSYKIVYLDVSEFLTESEYGDGLKVVNRIVQAKLGEDTTTNKNFLDLEGDDSSSKSLAVRSVDTDRTYTTEEITVKGGPLAKLLTDVGITKIDAKTDIQSLLFTLLCKEIYPFNGVGDSWYMADEYGLGNQAKVGYQQPNFTNSVGTPSVSNFTTGTVEAGTKFTYSVSTPATSTKNTASTVSNLTWGYSSSDDDSADSTATTITKNWTSGINNDVYTLKTTVNSGFGSITVADKTGTNSSRPSYSQEVQVADGSNKITWDLSGASYSATVVENPSVYMVSNLGKTRSDIKTNVIAAKTINCTTPTNSINKTVTGARYSFAGAKQGTTGITNSMELTSANIRALSSKGTSTTFTITFSDNTSHVYIALPPGKTLSKVEDTGAFGTDIVASFKANTRTDISVEGANGYTAKSYTVYIYAPDALLGANTYNITIK